ncbi:MAG TPA: alpha/beta hydrolase [Solirubrobacterales bacterium]|nr:alpha/beta hydrolase [Solirubrobacterales bacterium]
MSQVGSSSPDRAHTLPDGRTLAWCEYGPPDGLPVVYFHGIPGSRIDGRITAGAISAAGLRLIAPDRPDFGKSSLETGKRSHGGWARDVESLADRLGVERFAIVAYSAGGPYALAACIALAERLTSATIVSGAAPAEMPGYRKGVGPTNRVMLPLAARAPWLGRFLVGQALVMARKRPERFAKNANRDFSAPADRKVLDEELREELPELFLESGRGGPAGIVEDFAVWGRPSGLDLNRISTPIRLFHGEDDRSVPCAHSRWIASRIPSAGLTTWPGVGHLHTPVRWAEVYAAVE